MKLLEGMDQGEIARLFQQFVEEKLMGGGAKLLFRDIWAKYAAYGTSLTDGGRMRIRSWNTGQGPSEARILEFFGDLPYDQVNFAKADEYRIWRRQFLVQVTIKKGQKGRPIKASSINRHLRMVQAALSFAVKRQIIPRNPLAGLRDEPAPNDRGFCITQSDLLLICEQSPQWLRFFLLILWETGMRTSELRTLEWGEVDFTAGIIKLSAGKTKGGYERRFTMTALTKWILARLSPDGMNPHVFASRRDPRGPMSSAAVKRAWQLARQAAGVTGPKGQPIWMHTVRHTWATDAVTTCGIDVKTVMSMGGWKNAATADIYINIADQQRTAAAAKLDERSVSILKALQEGGSLRPKKKSPDLHVLPGKVSKK